MSGPVETLAFIAGIIGSVLVVGGFLRIVWRVTKRGQELAEAIPILERIAKAFDPEYGMSLPVTIAQLRDGIEELKATALAARTATELVASDLKESIAERRANADTLRIAVEMVKEQAIEDRRLAREDRQQLLDIIRSSLRIEKRVETAAAVAGAVADKLAEAQTRADDVADTEPPGAAADAASQSGLPKEP